MQRSETRLSSHTASEQANYVNQLAIRESEGSAHCAAYVCVAFVFIVQSECNKLTPTTNLLDLCFTVSVARDCSTHTACREYNEGKVHG